MVVDTMVFLIVIIFWLTFERPTYNVLRYIDDTRKSLGMKFSHIVFDKVDVIFLRGG